MDIDQTCESFDDLPLEMKHEIFSYLDHKTLTAATLVNKSWNDAIATSSTFATKTKLKIDSWRIFKRKPEVTFEKFWRHYQDIEIYYSHNYDHPQEQATFLRMCRALENFGKHLIKLNISMMYNFSSSNMNTNEPESSAILKLLQKCTRIKSLTLDYNNNTLKAPNAFDSNEIVELPSLKNLKLDRIDWILANIKCTKLHTLSVQNPKSDGEHIAEFINAQTKLVEFFGNGLNLETELKIVPKFHLNRVHAADLSSASASSLQNWKNLIRTAAPGAEVNLFCWDNQKVFHELMEFISELDNIRHLMITLDDVTSVAGYENEERINYGNFNHITSLTVSARETDLCYHQRAYIEQFILKFQKVETIYIVEMEDDYSYKYAHSYEDELIPMFAKLPSLKHLKMSLDGFKQILIRTKNLTVLPFIETVSITSCSSQDFLDPQNHKHVMFFGKRHKTIRTVTIDVKAYDDELATIDHSIVKQLAKEFPSAQTFEFRYSTYKTKKTITMSRQEISKLKRC